MPGAAEQRPQPASGVAVGEMVDASALPLGRAAVVERLKTAEYVLIGEAHAHPCDQLRQADILGMMAETGDVPALVIEYAPVTAQPVLDRFNRGELPLDELAGALGWSSVWGHDFESYRPIFAAARVLNIPVFAGNSPKSVVAKVREGGLAALKGQEKNQAPARIILPPKEQIPFLKSQFESHAGLVADKKFDAKAFERFCRIQSLWDTQMAGRAVAVRKETTRPVAVLAGVGHVENGWGVASRLKALEPKAKILLVAPWRGEGAPEKNAADLFYHCPESLRSRLGMVLYQQGGKVVVTAVDQGSTADKAGVRPGDVLAKVGDRPVASIEEFRSQAAGYSREGKPFTLTMNRTVGSVTVHVGYDNSK